MGRLFYAILKPMQKYVVLDKKVGQTPLQCADIYKETHPELIGVPMTYAGRLDPMASGKLLILLGDECKKQSEYHNLDKQYEFEVLLGVNSDTGDVLGLLNPSPRAALGLGGVREIADICHSLTGEVELPYPHYSAKTVRGKPLHTWALEEKIDEIEIPTKKSIIHKIKCVEVYTRTRAEVYAYASTKIETIPPVTELRKAIGNDFRRVDVRKDWNEFEKNGSSTDLFYIAKITCTVSSGTYMRTLAEVIGKKLDTNGLAYSIHRSKIGRYRNIPKTSLGLWIKRYT